MKHLDLREEYDVLEGKVLEALKEEVLKSKTSSKHISYCTAIKVHNVHNYEELVLVDDRLTFLDEYGIYYTAMLPLENLIDLLQSL